VGKEGIKTNPKSMMTCHLYRHNLPTVLISPIKSVRKLVDKLFTYLEHCLSRQLQKESLMD